MRSPFLNSAVDTSMGLALPSQARSERLLEPSAGVGVIRVAPEDAPEDLGRLFRESLVQAGPSEGDGGERVVGQRAAEPGRFPAGRRLRAEQAEQGPRLAIARVQARHGLEVLDSGV